MRARMEGRRGRIGGIGGGKGGERTGGSGGGKARENRRDWWGQGGEGIGGSGGWKGRKFRQERAPAWPKVLVQPGGRRSLVPVASLCRPHDVRTHAERAFHPNAVRIHAESVFPSARCARSRRARFPVCLRCWLRRSRLWRTAPT
eukprot:357977-Chlamydomonas_euryale.AAC.1